MTHIRVTLQGILFRESQSPIESRAYLREATLRVVRNPGTVTLARDFKSVETREKSAIDFLAAEM